MIQEAKYSFTIEDYDKNGFNIHTGQLFSEFIKECEIHFHKEFIIFYADYLFANSSAMLLLKRCFVSKKNEDFGMDLIDGEINLDKNLEIENYSKRKTIYAIETQYSLEEPLFLIIDDTLYDGVFILKYISDDDDNEDNVEYDIPVNKIPEKIFK
jgi:hypothetical protein